MVARLIEQSAVHIDTGNVAGGQQRQELRRGKARATAYLEHRHAVL
ncbi:MAG: hypothetical protein R2867_25295 [Caldilineaceae bacterium]